MRDAQPTYQDTLDRLYPNDPGPIVVRVGADIGKQQDHTAISVTEEVRRDRTPHYLVRHLERLPLGTSYPAVADRIVDVMQALDRRRERVRRRADIPYSIYLTIDGTGVGLPVADLVREGGYWPTVALFTGSEKLTVHPDDVVMVGKAWMVSKLQVLLQAHRLHLPQTLEASALVRELADYQIAVSDRGHASFNARSGSHDDLVIALGLSVGVGDQGGEVSSRSYLEPRERTTPGMWETRRRR